MKQSDQKIAKDVLFTYQYQLTMPQLCYRLSLHEKQLQFDHFCRDYPDYGLHQTGYCVNAGLLLIWRKTSHLSRLQPLQMPGAFGEVLL